MSLRPLGSRLLIKPDPPATVINGILVPQTADKPPAMTGTVIAVGRGPASAHAVRVATLQQIQEQFVALADQVAAEAVGSTSPLFNPFLALRHRCDTVMASLMRDAVSVHDVAEGDCVCFAFTAGTNLTVDGEPYILMAEDDLEAVWTPDEIGVA